MIDVNQNYVDEHLIDIINEVEKFQSITQGTQKLRVISDNFDDFKDLIMEKIEEIEFYIKK